MKKEVLIKKYTVLLSLIAVLSIIGLVTTLQTKDITTDSLSPLVPQVWAQAPTGMPNPDGQQIIQQGVSTSSPDPLPGHEAHQSITILRLRNDNAVYSGTLTFTATAPVEVQVLHRNMTTTGGGGAATTTTATPVIPEEFGTMSMLPLPGGNGIVTISNIIPSFPEDTTTFSGSVPFTGNAIALHNIEGEPFAATYTVTADVVGAATRADDISMASPLPAAEEEVDDEEEVDEEEEEEEEVG